MSYNATAPTEEELITAYYGYVPTRWICYTFLSLFGVTTILHLGQTFFFKPRLYWLLPTVVMCGIGETIGWSARLWSSINPVNHAAFMTQLVTTIIAPTFLTAALYTILGLIIQPLGPQYSRLNPKTYIIVFVIADVLALVVQAVGGGIAATANTRATSNLGSHIMVAGIFLQMAGLTIYTILATEFLLRFYLQKPLSLPKTITPPVISKAEDNNIPPAAKHWTRNGTGLWEERGAMTSRMAMMVLALAFATLFVFIRTIYRSVELLGGWHGHIIRTEVFFDVLDATPIILAMSVLNIFPPGLLLRDTTPS